MKIKEMVGRNWWEVIPVMSALAHVNEGHGHAVFHTGSKRRVYVNLWDDTVMGVTDSLTPLMYEPHACDRCGTLYDETGGDGYMGLCPSCADDPDGAA